VVKRVRDLIDGVYSDKGDDKVLQGLALGEDLSLLDEKEAAKRIKQLEKQMLEHARNLEFEQAAQTRDQMARIKREVFGTAGHDS